MALHQQVEDAYCPACGMPDLVVEIGSGAMFCTYRDCPDPSAAVGALACRRPVESPASEGG